MAQLNFDANTVAPDENLEPIPAGWYNFTIVESEMKPTSSGDGAYLELQLQVMDGQHAGRKVFDRLNLQNNNPVAVEIAYKRLSAYCHATGVIQVQDSQQLHGIPLMAKVNVRQDKSGQYGPSNEIKGVKPAENTGQPAQGGQPWAQQQPPQQAPQAPQQPPQGQPWDQNQQAPQQPAPQQPQGQPQQPWNQPQGQGQGPAASAQNDVPPWAQG